MIRIHYQLVHSIRMYREPPARTFAEETVSAAQSAEREIRQSLYAAFVALHQRATCQIDLVFQAVDSSKKADPYVDDDLLIRRAMWLKFRD
jgi:hypothetical protein